MLDISNLTKQFGSHKAVNGVSFSISPGEVYSLIGPNGSGKTTIIKIIAGLLQPGSGHVTVDGHDVTKEPVAAKAAIGYIPDEPAVWPGMTGEEFLHFTGALYDIPEKERREAIPNLLMIFNLAGIEKGYFEDYSRGNKQKFAILAAFLHKPKLLLIDEPIVGLDPESAHIAKKEFAKFTGQGGAVLLVTHTLDVAQEISHRVGVLEDGHLVAEGSFEQLVARANLGSHAVLEDVYAALT